MKSERFNRGSEILNQLRAGGADRVVKGWGDFAPDMANYILEYIFGDLYARDGLDLKTKQIITITALAVLGNANAQLAYHIENGLNIGLSRQEIIDILIHVSGYAGFPAALNGLSTAREVFAKRENKEIKS